LPPWILLAISITNATQVIQDMITRVKGCYGLDLAQGRIVVHIWLPRTMIAHIFNYLFRLSIKPSTAVQRAKLLQSIISPRSPTLTKHRVAGSILSHCRCHSLLNKSNNKAILDYRTMQMHHCPNTTVAFIHVSLLSSAVYTSAVTVYSPLGIALGSSTSLTTFV